MQFVVRGWAQGQGPRAQGTKAQGPRDQGQRPKGAGAKAQGPRAQGPRDQGQRPKGPGARAQGPRDQGQGPKGPRAQGPRSPGRQLFTLSLVTCNNGSSAGPARAQPPRSAKRAVARTIGSLDSTLRPLLDSAAFTQQGCLCSTRLPLFNAASSTPRGWTLQDAPCPQGFVKAQGSTRHAALVPVDPLHQQRSID